MVVQQCCEWQARLILPLVGDAMAEFKDSIVKTGALLVSLANTMASHGVMSLMACNQDSMLDQVEKATVKKNAEPDSAPFLASLAKLMYVLLQPSALKSLDESREVEQVCVTYVLPPELRAQLEALVGVENVSERQMH